MIDYKISSTLTVKDELTPALEKIAALGKQVNEQMSALRKNLNAIGGAFNKAAAGANNFASAQGRAFSEFSTGANKAESSATKMGSAIVAMNARARESASIGGAVALYGYGGRGGPPSAGGGGRSGGGGRDIVPMGEPEWYGGHRTGYSKRPGDIEDAEIIGGGGRGGGRGNNGSGMGGFEAMYAGSMVQHTGIRMLESLRLPIEKAMELARLTASLRQKGIGEDNIKDALKFAEATQIYGTSILDRVRIFTDAQGSFRESGMKGPAALSAAKEMMPMLAKYEVASSFLDEKSKAAAAGSMVDLNKIVEMLGGLGNHERAKQITDAVFKAAQSSGHIISARDLKQVMAHGGSALQQQDLRGLFGGMEPIIGEVGGSAFATGALTAYNRMLGLTIGGPQSKQLIHEALRLGIWDKKQVIMKGDKIDHILPGGPLRSDLKKLLNTDIGGFSDAIQKIYEANKITNLTDMMQENAILFGRTGSGKVYNRSMMQKSVRDSSLASYDVSGGVESTMNNNQTSPLGSFKEFDSKMTDLMTIWGRDILPVVNEGLEVLNPALSGLGRTLDHLPVQTMTVLFIELGAAMAISGTIVLVTSSFSILKNAMLALEVSAPMAAIALKGVGISLGLINAAYLGWTAGTKLYDAAIAGTKFGDVLGEIEARFLAFFGNKEAQDALDRMHGKTAPPAGHLNYQYAPFSAPPKKDINITANLNVDGKKMTSIMFKHAADGMNGPTSTLGGFDANQSFFSPSMPGAALY